MAEIQKSQGEYKPLAKVEELEEANYNMIDNVLNNMPPKKEPYLEYFAAECDEFHDMGAYEKSTDVNQIAAVYEKYRENPENAYRVCSMGIIYRDPEDSYYDDAEFAIVKGNTVLGNLMDDVRFYGELALIREGIEKIHDALPDYKYVPMRDVREAMYPEKMTTEQLAEALDEIAEAFDPYEYRDNVETGENTVQEVMLDLQSGNTHSYISYLKDIVDEECDQSVRAGVLIERLKVYEPEFPKNLEPMVYVNYCEESALMNPRCQKLSELDAKTAEMDKEWYAKRDSKTEEPTKITKIYVTVYYAEKGEQMLHHFKKSIDIGNGHGGIVSQLKYDNEMKLTDEYWINYQKGKGSEEFQKYMEDLTDMQNHVLPYLQSFCNLEEKGVKERREQQITERNEGRADERGTSTEANAVVKDAGKADRKAENVKERLLQHLRDYQAEKEKYYWTTAVIFIGRDLNKALIRFLENRFVDIARQCKRYLVLTKNTYRNTVMKESQIAVMEEFIDNVRILISVLGYKVLEPVNKPAAIEENDGNEIEKEEIKLHLERTVKGIGKIEADGIRTSEGFVVLNGSHIAPEDDETISAGIKEKRSKANIVEGILQEDVLFSSPSGAAMFVVGKSANGLTSWKNADGITLKDIESDETK